MDNLQDKLNEQLELEALAAAIQREAYAIMKEVKVLLPIKTGNLRNNSLRLVETSEGFEIYLDDIIAPYIEYPNLKAKLDVIWPDLVNKFTTLLAASIGGTIE